ncbi:hypothetical protein K7G98_14885 [Saccharothrix sp. MB29]|nr:hypothetical protein [Saccharothrix sp. MB29]
MLPATTPEHDVVDRYVRALAAELEHVNAYRVPHARLRMRMAIHFGITTEGANGYPGSDAVLVSRLLDSQAARAGLEQTGADLVVVLSEAVYTSLVRGGYTTLRPADFRRVDAGEDLQRARVMWIPQGDARAVRLRTRTSPRPPALSPPARRVGSPRARRPTTARRSSRPAGTRTRRRSAPT